jgi:hypothetical protein
MTKYLSSRELAGSQDRVASGMWGMNVSTPTPDAIELLESRK